MKAYRCSDACAALLPDFETLDAPWSWFGNVVGPALANGPDPLIGYDLAHVTLWGFDPASIRVPVLLLHGERDGIAPASHSRWLASRISWCGTLVDAERRPYISSEPRSGRARLDAVSLTVHAHFDLVVTG